MSISIKQQKLLIVEGRDEENFFDAAFRNHLKATEIQILPIGPKTILSQNLKTFKKDPAFPSVVSLVIARDADLTSRLPFCCYSLNNRPFKGSGKLCRLLAPRYASWSE